VIRPGKENAAQFSRGVPLKFVFLGVLCGLGGSKLLSLLFLASWRLM
jgi:hypothetical protein